ncbi:MAG: helix-turn-helix transcriptional regulator [Clostridia bacterium]|nr:helix-turn-helix transcriptional regulator [Clostridia bacterium]
MYTIAESLKEHRERRQYSQSELARKTGIAQPKISYYENERHIPPVDLCMKLADFYEISLDDLVGRNFK